SARKDRRADIVRERVGCKRAQRDKNPRDIFDAEMKKGNPIVPSKRGICDERRKDRQHMVPERNRFEMLQDLWSDGFAFKLVVEKPKRDRDRSRAKERPEKIENALHCSPGGQRQPIVGC